MTKRAMLMPGEWDGIDWAGEQGSQKNKWKLSQLVRKKPQADRRF
jgi:hypothetical protein